MDELRSMIRWSADEEPSKFQLSRLKGHQLAAKLDGVIVAIILQHYELDKQSLGTMLQGKHVMVVDNLALSPSIASSKCHVMFDAGIRHELTQMAACHSMRVQFCPQSCCGQ